MSNSQQQSLSTYRTRDHDDFIGSIFDSFLGVTGERGSTVANKLSGWSGDIKVDSSETDSEFLISADLPGVSKEDIKVSLSADRMLSIEAERKHERSGGEEGRNHWQERTFGRIHRSFRLPRNVDPDNCACQFENGVLNVRVGKRDPTSDTRLLQID